MQVVAFMFWINLPIFSVVNNPVSGHLNMYMGKNGTAPTPFKEEFFYGDMTQFANFLTDVVDVSLGCKKLAEGLEDVEILL